MTNYAYIKSALQRMKDIRDDFLDGELDEQAIPAYLDGNVLSRQIFISRLIIAMHMVNGTKQKRQCLDFGCGSGILLPWLTERFDHVHGVDLDLRFARLFCGENAKLTLSTAPTADMAPKSLDLILALDVLEHMHEPAETICELAELLRPEGLMIISGPTENWIYRMGRRIVGFDGHYHHTNIYDIGDAAGRLLHLKRKVRVLPLLPLFEILCLASRPQVCES